MSEGRYEVLSRISIPYSMRHAVEAAGLDPDNLWTSIEHYDTPMEAMFYTNLYAIEHPTETVTLIDRQAVISVL